MSKEIAPLEIIDICKSFKTGFLNLKKIEVLKGYSIKLKKGEIFGLLGPNGAGKTTSLKIVTGLIFPDKGNIKIFGKSNKSLSARKKLGFLPENPYFYDYLTAKEFLYMASDIFAIPQKIKIKRVKTLLEKLGIAQYADLPLRKFSKGMLQRAGLAQALINDPELVILDEPLSGLDPIGRKELRDIILDLKSQGKTILFSSHILADVEEMCDRVAIIVDGKLKEMGKIETLLEKGKRGNEIEIQCEKELLDKVNKKYDSLKIVSLISGHRIMLPNKIDLQPFLKFLIENNIKIIGVKSYEFSLEDLFMTHYEKKIKKLKKTEKKKDKE
jgi:ABC-2 type transport system ATP-binding protein